MTRRVVIVAAVAAGLLIGCGSRPADREQSPPASQPAAEPVVPPLSPHTTTEPTVVDPATMSVAPDP